MTTYNNYYEARIANPEEDIYKINDRFMVCNPSPNARVDHVVSPCNPADHCMTVEQFLKDGHKFVEGDLYVNFGGFVTELTERKINSLMSLDTSRRFILRAAALEEKTNTESDYDKGMREAMEKIAKSCGRSFCVDIGYEDLPDLVESLINPKPEEKPKRAKVEYVKCDYLQDALDKFESMVVFEFYPDNNGVGDRINSVRYLALAYGNNSLYRRIETEIDERDVFIEKVELPDLEEWFWWLDHVNRKNEYRMKTKEMLAKLLTGHYGQLFDAGCRFKEGE